MKKRIGVLLGILVFGFIFIIPVLAQEEVDLEIKINGVRQGSRQLVFEDDYYIIDGYEELYIDYEVLNYDEEDDGKYYKVLRGTNGSGSSRYMGETFEIVGNLDFKREFNEYTISICSDIECNDKVYASKAIKYKTGYFNELQNSKVYLTSVKQDGKDIDYSLETQRFQLNDKQDVVINLKGENLLDNAYYTISTGTYDDEVKYLGSELEEGITFTHYTNLRDYLHLSCIIEGIRIDNDIFYQVDGEDKNFYFEFVEDDSATAYEAKLFYTNYRDVEIVQNEDEYGYYDFYVVNSKYHNNKDNNTLSFDIKGSNYEDKPYTVGVNVTRDNEVVCSQYIDVNGLILNEGYQISIDKLVLELNDVIEDDRKPYHIYLMIGDVRQDFKVLYNSVGKYAKVDVRMFFENGKKNLSVFRGTGNFTYGGGIYDTNKDVFEKYSSIYLQFFGNNFLDNEMYEYVLEYGYYNDNWNGTDYGRYYDDVLETGEVSGRILNNIGLIFKVGNNKKYENPAYRLIIKNGNEVIYSAIPVVATMDDPSLANVSLSANNKNLHLRLDDHTYVSTRNNHLEIVITGLGFEEDEVYPLNFCYSKRLKGDLYEDGGCEEINVKGDDLNKGKGTAKFKFDKKIEHDALEYNFYVSGGSNKVPVQGGFTVKFVDSRELFPKVVKYVVDNVSDLIKNISKNTSVNDFVSNIEVSNNGSVKLFDSKGEEEVTDKVGTGMIARVMDEFNSGILDLDVVVKGDVTGDGNISITDLVKVKKHLAKVESIDGIYELGGDITGTGTIGITDLVKMAKDVAKIEEVK